MHEKNGHTEAQRLCQTRIPDNIQRLKIAQVAPTHTTRHCYKNRPPHALYGAHHSFQPIMPNVDSVPVGHCIPSHF